MYKNHKPEGPYVLLKTLHTNTLVLLLVVNVKVLVPVSFANLAIYIVQALISLQAFWEGRHCRSFFQWSMNEDLQSWAVSSFYLYFRKQNQAVHQRRPFQIHVLSEKACLVVRIVWIKHFKLDLKSTSRLRFKYCS